MLIGIIIGISVILSGDGFSKKENSVEQEGEAKSGLHIEYGPNLGTTHTDNLGVRHFYVHCTAIITNDSAASINLQLALANEYDFPSLRRSHRPLSKKPIISHPMS